MAQDITRDLVLSRMDALPAFPKTVQEIVATVDDPDSNMSVLSHVVGRDPAIAGRVLAAANKAAANSRRSSGVDDIFTAASLVGMQQVRDIAVLSSLTDFVGAMGHSLDVAELWRHSVSVGVCAQEMALYVEAEISLNHALIAGLLHDIGQFWLLQYDHVAYARCWSDVARGGLDIRHAEEREFGVDHAQIGAWLATVWGLPTDIRAAIAGHHQPDTVLQPGPLVALLHVAEVVSNALELGGSSMSRVTYLSPQACQQLGLVWDDGVRSMFGRIEARARHVTALLAT
jgi:putative nucleotidyltransferase with HDIG domain